MSGRKDFTAAGGAESAAASGVCRRGDGVWGVSVASALHHGGATGSHTTSLRRRADPHAAASHGGGDAIAAMFGGASVCGVEVPHLRASALSVARPRRSADGNQLGDHGLQPETHDEGARRCRLMGGPGQPKRCPCRRTRKNAKQIAIGGCQKLQTAGNQTIGSTVS